MRIYFQSILLSMVVCLVSSGCALPRRGMLDTNIYYSNQSPNIKITVKENFHYKKGESQKFQHQFFDRENHRIVYIQHYLHEPNQTQIDYYGNPEKWIYESSDSIFDIERFTEKNLGEKWYVQDYVKHVSTMACFMVRDFKAFTSRNDVFRLMYVWQMPPYLCEKWSFVKSLDDSQQQYLREFREGLAGDIQMEEYTEK